MAISGVYRYRHIETNKAYIGSSIDLERRHREHLSKNRKGCWRFYNALNKYGIDSFIYEIVEPIYNTKELSELTFKNYIVEREQVWLDMYFAQEYVIDSNNKNFLKTTYNIKPLAGKGTGQKWTEEAKERHSKMLKLNPTTKGTKRSLESNQKTSETRKKKEVAKGDKNPNYGKKSTADKKAKYIATKTKTGSLLKFYRIDKDLVVTGPFIGLRGYCITNGLQPRGIYYCIREPDKCKQYKGYTYCLEQDIENRKTKIIENPNYWKHEKNKKQ